MKDNKMKRITDSVYYVGVNDRQKDKFENLWLLPHGVSYNSYLIVDEKTVLVDTVDVSFSDIFLKKVAEALGGRTLDYLIVNHMEPDHSGSIRLLRHFYPGVQIIGSKQAGAMLEGYHGITEEIRLVKEGDTLPIGSRELTFFMAPMVHWPEVMFTYDPKDKILFSADAFGTYGALDGGVIDSEMDADRYWDEMIRYYANIVGKYGNPVQKALQKLSGVTIGTICPTHGPVWRERRAKAIEIYDRLSRYEGEEGVTIIYGTMYGNTEQMAEAIAGSLADNGVRNIILHNTVKSPASFILRDIFKYKGLIIGSPTYNGQLFPEIEAIVSKIESREVKNRIFGYFGSYTWAGSAVKRLAAFTERMGWQTVGIPVEQKMAIQPDKYEECIALGKAMALEVKGER